jgi:hypothetical protein
MKRNKSTVSKAESYTGIGEFWDSHDLEEHWEKTESVTFEVDLLSETTYYALDKTLSAQMQTMAEQHGISPETLLNLWVQEKLQDADIQQ